MARSLKKGAFADESLLKKVDALNAANDKQVIKTWLLYGMGRGYPFQKSGSASQVPQKALG